METWQRNLLKNFTSWETLANFLELGGQDLEKVVRKSRFPLNFPYRLAEKAKKGTLDDPIIKQFLPLIDEEEVKPGFQVDPVSESSFSKTEKLLQKYQGRALVVSTSACGMHCRFCFRQNYPYQVERKDFAEEFQILREDKSITEVILSGGDPLTLPNKQIALLFTNLEEMKHVDRIRIHTRMPLAFPERIDQGLLDIFQASKKQLIFVTHANHPIEFDEEVFSSLKKIHKQGALLLNQSVLLKGINDNKETLIALFLSLANQGILPYYLHQLDRVKGAHHFEVPIEEGKELIKAVIGELPGYAVPKYVQEIPNQPSKTVIL